MRKIDARLTEKCLMELEKALLQLFESTEDRWLKT